MFDLKDYRFVKVILASTAVDKSGDKISMKALNDLQWLCLNKTGTIEIPEYKTDCTIVNSFICSSNESDGTGEVAYNLYGILAFNAQSISGKYISDMIENLGRNNLYDVASISFVVGSSEMLTTQLVRNILSIKDFLNFSYNVRSKNSVRNQEKLNDIIKKSDICPFCGSKPIVTVDGENISGLDKFRITIKCMNIECNVQPKTSFYDSSFTTACDMALKHWNTRSSNTDTDTRCCVNCVNCCKDDDGMYYCVLDYRFIPGEHPFRHTDCDDFEQKDSNILSCASTSESVSKTTKKDDKTSLCLSCGHADFGPDGCWCDKAESFVCTKLMNNCKYFDRVARE